MRRRRQMMEAEALRVLARKAQVVDSRAGWLASLLAGDPKNAVIKNSREDLAAALRDLDGARDAWIEARIAEAGR